MVEVIKLQNLSKTYKKHRVLNDVTLTINKGNIYGLVGRNGAGKTTIMKIICGFVQPSSGEYFLFENGKSSKKDNLKQIGALIENPGFYPELSGFENLKLKCLAHGCYTKQYTRSLLKKVGLNPKSQKAAKKYSLGMQQRLGIALALVGEPEILILDEPMNGLDPQGFKELTDLLIKLTRENFMTILISSHILQKLSEIADHFAIIDNGKLISSFSRSQLLKQMNNEIEVIVNDSSKAQDALNSFHCTVSIISQNIIRISSTMLNEKEIESILSDFGVEVQNIYQKEINFEDIYLKIINEEGVER